VADGVAIADVRITQLDSGLTVATERVPGARSVATGAWVVVGARDEPASLAGVSHFLEHLLFKGTPTRSARDISAAIERVGGDMNAFTSKEYTSYYCRVPGDQLALGLEVLGDVLSRPALRDDDVETEREVILEELMMDDDSPEDVVHRDLAEALFPGGTGLATWWSPSPDRTTTTPCWPPCRRRSTAWPPVARRRSGRRPPPRCPSIASGPTTPNRPT
jgi:predicted Zn-dependent peptidase